VEFGVDLLSTSEFGQWLLKVVVFTGWMNEVLRKLCCGVSFLFFLGKGKKSYFDSIFLWLDTINIPPSHKLVSVVGIES